MKQKKVTRLSFLPGERRGEKIYGAVGDGGAGRGNCSGIQARINSTVSLSMLD
jgi:hypothetical protein